MTIESKHQELERVTNAVEEFGSKSSWSDELIFKVNLVLEELTLNIMDYGYEDDAVHLIEVCVKTDEDTVTIEIVDDGRPFNPISDAPQPDLNASISDRHVGGWGIHIVRTIMDVVTYEREENKNKMKLVASRAG